MRQRQWQVPDHVVMPGGNMGNSSAFGKAFSEMRRMGLIDRIPKLSVIQAEGAAPLARLFSNLVQSGTGTQQQAQIEMVAHPRTLATAIKIGAPVSWKKALRAVLQSDGNVISVSESELADAKAVIGFEGIGCEPASAATVAGIKKLVVMGKIGADESVVAILTGHVLKDPDYVSHYHRGTLSLATGTDGHGEKSQAIVGSFRNAPVRVAATKDAIVERLQRQ
jgi:threonine synthase